MSKYFLLLSLFVLSLPFLFGTNNVFAASIWDDVIQVSPTLEIASYNGAHSRDITTDYMGLVAAEPTCDTTRNRFLDVVGNYPEAGNWTIFMQTYGPEKQAFIWFTEDSDSEINFVMDGSYPGVEMDKTIGYMNIALYNDDTVHVICETFITGEQPAFLYRDPANSGGIGYLQFLTTYPVNYPPDYDGEEIPSTGSPPVDPLPYIPRINVVSVVDWKITLQDQNFNTFDPVPFTCNMGLTPLIDYVLYNHSTSQIISEGIFSPTIQYVFQANDYAEQTEFRFQAKYYCGDLPDDPTFDNDSNTYFTVNAAGFLELDTASCFTEEFPFIDVDGCTTVIEDFLNNLTFGMIAFPDFTVNPNECHTLTTIGDWINVAPSSRLICPQFSSTIRNAVTPFLTFVMGITIMGAIVTKSRNSVV